MRVNAADKSDRLTDATDFLLGEEQIELQQDVHTFSNDDHDDSASSSPMWLSMSSLPSSTQPVVFQLQRLFYGACPVGCRTKGWVRKRLWSRGGPSGANPSLEMPFASPPFPTALSSGKASVILGIATLVIFLATGLSIFNASFLPHATASTAAAAATPIFSGELARSHLANISAVPHPLGSAANQRVRVYVAAVVRGLANTAAYLGKRLEIIDEGVDQAGINVTRIRRFYGTEQDYFESTNILVRLHGQTFDTLSSALLVSAHLDSVPTSPGASDDGAAIAAMLEALRCLVLDPSPNKYPVIFNFNNGEEGGLRGGYAFRQHPWWPSVKSFINMDGGGSGGRWLVNRVTHFALIDAYAQVARYPHANVVGNDIFAMLGPRQIMNSFGSTDFWEYAVAGGAHGIDLGLYDKGGFYHSKYDSLETVSTDSLQHLGDNILPLIRHLSQIDLLQTISDFTDFDSLLDSERPIFYDILGTKLVHMTLRTYRAVTHSLSGVTLAALIAVGWRNVRCFKVFLVVLATIAGYTGVVAIATAIVGKVKRDAIYGRPWLIFLIFGAVMVAFLFLGAHGIMRITHVRRRGWVLRTIRDTDAALLAILCIGQIASSVAAAKGFGALYVFFWLTLCRLLCLLAVQVGGIVNRRTCAVKECPISAALVAWVTRPLGQFVAAAFLFLLGNFLPWLILLDGSGILARIVVPGVRSGPGASASYYLCGGLVLFTLLGTLSTLLLTPPRPSHRLRLAAGFAVVALVAFVCACLVFPYGVGQAALARIRFAETHDYNQDASWNLPDTVFLNFGGSDAIELSRHIDFSSLGATSPASWSCTTEGCSATVGFPMGTNSTQSVTPRIQLGPSQRIAAAANTTAADDAFTFVIPVRPNYRTAVCQVTVDDFFANRFASRIWLSQMPAPPTCSRYPPVSSFGKYQQTTSIQDGTVADSEEAPCYRLFRSTLRASASSGFDVLVSTPSNWTRLLERLGTSGSVNSVNRTITLSLLVDCAASDDESEPTNPLALWYPRLAAALPDWMAFHTGGSALATIQAQSHVLLHFGD